MKQQTCPALAVHHFPKNPSRMTLEQAQRHGDRVENRRIDDGLRTKHAPDAFAEPLLNGRRPNICEPRLEPKERPLEQRIGECREAEGQPETQREWD